MAAGDTLRSTAGRRVSTPRWTPIALVVLVALLAVAGIAIHARAGDQGQGAQPITGRAYLAGAPVTLSIADPVPGQDRVTVRLRGGGPAALTARVDDPAGYTPVVSRARLTRQGAVYAGRLEVPQGRSRIRIGGTGGDEAVFVARVGAGTALPPRIDPMLASPPGGSPASGTISLGAYTARIAVAPVTFGWNSIDVRFLPSSRFVSPPPQSLRVRLTMEDMDMGVTNLVAHRTGPGAYRARGAFAMGGLWRIAVSWGSISGSALVYVNAAAPGQTQAAGPGFRPPVVHTDFPYNGFVTEMRTNDVARLNGEIASAGQTPHGVDYLAHQPFIYVTDMGGDAVRVVAIRTGKVVATIPVGLGPAHIVFTPNDARAYVTDFLSADVSVVDTRLRRLIARIPVGLNPHGLDISPDGQRVYVACAHGAGVWVIGTATNTVVKTIPTGLEPYGVTMGPPGSDKVYISDYALNQVDVVSLRRGVVVRRIPVGRAPALMVLAPNGRLYVADHDSGTVSVIDTRTDRVVATVGVGAGPHGLDVTPDGKYVYVANNNSNSVSVIQTSSSRVVETVRVPGRPNEVALQQRDDVSP